MHYTIPKTNLAPDLIFCQKNCDDKKQKTREPGSALIWGSALTISKGECVQFKNSCVDRPAIVNTQHKTDWDVFEPANSCLKKPWLTKKTGKHGKTTLVPGCLLFCFHLGASWSFRCRFLMSLHAHLDFD